MDHEDKLAMMARILALEYLFKRLFWLTAVLRADLDGEDEADVLENLSTYAKLSQDDLRTATIPFADPAISDHVSALVSENVQRLVDETMALVRRHNPGLQG